MFGLCFKVLPHLPAKVLRLVFQWLVFDLCARDHPRRFLSFWDRNPFQLWGETTKLPLMPHWLPFTSEGKRGEMARSRSVFSFPNLPPPPSCWISEGVYSLRDLALTHLPPWGNGGLKLLWNGGQTQPPDCKHLIVPGLYGCQTAAQ